MPSMKCFFGKPSPRPSIQSSLMLLWMFNRQSECLYCVFRQTICQTASPLFNCVTVKCWVATLSFSCLAFLTWVRSVFSEAGLSIETPSLSHDSPWTTGTSCLFTTTVSLSDSPWKIELISFVSSPHDRYRWQRFWVSLNILQCS